MKSVLLYLFIISMMNVSTTLAGQGKHNTNVSSTQTASSEPKKSDPPAATEMKKLSDLFCGTWSITESILPNNRLPQGDTAHGKELWRTLVGGTPLIEEYQSTSSQGTAYDSAAIWWDAKAKEYKGIWCAAINDSGCSEFTVSWNSDNISMEGDSELSGTVFHWFETFSFSGSDSFRQTLDIGQLAKPMQRVSEIQANRTGSCTTAKETSSLDFRQN